jgi:hypothetical protein
LFLPTLDAIVKVVLTARAKTIFAVFAFALQVFLGCFIIASMMTIAVEYRRRTAKRHQEEFFRKLRWEELQQLKTQIEAEEARSRRLESGADNWHRARRIREYVLALVECKKKQEKELGPHTALGKWTIWALQQADRIDPLTESPSSILDRKRELEGWSP